jgi:cytochrome c oxidase subunit III
MRFAMSTYPTQSSGQSSGQSGGASADARPLWARYKFGHHFRNAHDEFEASKFGFWLFLSTEVLLFAGIFCAYALFRAMYPEAWAEGSKALDWKVGTINTVVLLVSSFTMAYAIYCFQTDKQQRARQMLVITFFAGLTFLLVKFGFEYMPKWSGYFFSFDPALSKYTANIVPEQARLGGLIQFVEGYGGKRPGKMFDYPFATNPQMPIWWAVYYSGTVIHASHVVIGMALIARAWWRARKGHYGPGHYTFVEITGLYWHLVDLVWIFLFPLLYLIH